MNLKTLDNYTAQEVFDFVKNHLLKQNRKSLMPENYEGLGGCAYRGRDGLKCAVGCLIDDEQYKSSMEGGNVDRIYHGFHSELLDRLQKIHDCINCDEWFNELFLLSDDLKLEWSE